MISRRFPDVNIDFSWEDAGLQFVNVKICMPSQMSTRLGKGNVLRLRCIRATITEMEAGRRGIRNEGIN